VAVLLQNRTQNAHRCILRGTTASTHFILFILCIFVYSKYWQTNALNKIKYTP
jgi:hypothetical protein